MREWYSAEELAGLPGLPGTRRGVNTVANRDKWTTKTEKVRGGNRNLYHWTSLPNKTRVALFEREKGQAPTTEARVTEPIRKASDRESADIGLRRVAQLGGIRAVKAAGRVEIINVWKAYLDSSKLPRSKAIQHFVHDYNTALIEVSSETRGAIPDISRTSLYRWVQSPAGKGTNRCYVTIVDRQPELREFLVAMIIDHPKTSVANLHHAAESRFRGMGIEITLPSKRRLAEWVKRWKQENKELLTAATHPDAWKSNYMLAFGSSSEGINAPNQLWELDSTPADLMLKDGRHSLIGAIDIYTRRAKMIVVPTSTAAGIALLMRRCLIDWGVPDGAKTDRGADYMSARTQLTLESLHIAHIPCPPFEPWHKPHVERFFRTFSHSIVELLPGYIGHNVAERSAIEDRQAFADRLFKRDHHVNLAELTAAEFQKICDEWVEGIYHHTAHSGIDNETPAQRWTEWPGSVRRIEDERLLDVLLAEIRPRTVTKKGISIDGIQYIAPEFGLYARQSVIARLDPQDIGRVYCFSADTGEFICIAEAPAYTGISREQVANEAKRIQRQRVSEGRKELRSLSKRQDVKGIADEILAEARRRAKVTSLPRPTETHTGSHITAAADAIRARTPQPVEPTPEQEHMTQEVREQLKQPAELVPLETPRQRYQRWLRLQVRVDNGETLDQQDLGFYQAYPKTPQFKAQRDMDAAFNVDSNQSG